MKSTSARHTRSSACARSSLRSSMSSMPDRDAHQAVGDAERGAAIGRHRRVRHRRGMGDQRFDAAEALGERAQPHRVEQPPRGLERSEVERDHAAEAAHLFLRQRVLRMGRQPRIVAPGDLRVRLQKLRHGEAVLVVPLHPERQRLGAAQHQPRVERAEDRALGVLHELQPLDVVVPRRDDDAADAVAVAVEILRRAVHDQVGAEFDRPLDVRAGERVVDDEPQVVAVRERGGARPDRSAA